MIVRENLRKGFGQLAPGLSTRVSIEGSKKSLGKVSGRELTVGPYSAQLPQLFAQIFAQRALLTKHFLPLLVILLLLLPGCTSSTRTPTFPQLANQGMLPLSTSNGYVGANIFLAGELERSQFLFKFFEGRGAPAAIEIIERGTRPVEMLLFYPKDKEVYTAELIKQDAYNRQWVVRGPYPISRKDYRSLGSLNLSMHGEPVFPIYGKEYRFRFHRSQKDSSYTALKRSRVEPEIPIIPKPTPKPKRKPVLKEDLEKKKKEELQPKVPDFASIDPKTFRPLNSDQQALGYSQGYAKRNSSGDLLHEVRLDKENLKAIAAWYTGTEANAEALAKRNGLDLDAPLKPGKQILVPIELLKTAKRMPE